MVDKPLISPLRYPGSKRRLVKYIKEALELNNLHPKLYIESFVGGASVALQLMQDSQVDKVILMDIDPWITSFWKTVFFDTEWLVNQIQETKVSLDIWHQLKQSTPKTVRDQAWACFYLNRTSFSGILEKKVGPLGGRKQESEYKIDCRFPKETLIKRISKAAKHRTKIHGIWNCSWDVGLQTLRGEQGANKLPHKELFFYFDPPFFEKAESLYRFYFRDKDHVLLRDYLLTLEDSWILSYDSATQVEQLYGDAIHHRTNGANRHHVNIYYSLAIMAERRTAKEVIISNLPNLPT